MGWWRVVLILLFSVGMSPSASGQAALEHFVCSEFELAHPPPALPLQPVSLEDQFGRLDAKVKAPRYLCAPAGKIHGGREFPPANLMGPHLACYELLETGTPGRYRGEITLTNQFELDGSKGNVAERLLLCVPTAKILLPERGEPEFDREAEVNRVQAALNHFQCWDFWPDESGERHREAYRFNDQFGSFEGNIRRPNVLCAPVIKTIRDRPTEPQGGLKGPHLACYIFHPLPAIDDARDVLLVNQLHPTALRGKVKTRKMFCVPTSKTLASAQ